MREKPRVKVKLSEEERQAIQEYRERLRARERSRTLRSQQLSEMNRLVHESTRYRWIQKHQQNSQFFPVLNIET